MSSNAQLRITDIVWDAANQPKPGTPVTFTVTLKNEGPEPLEAFQQQTTIIIYVDRDEQTRLKYDGGLEPGESITFDSHVWDAVAGNHVITAELNFIRPSADNWNTGVNFVKNLRVAEEALPVPAPAAEAGMNTLIFSDDFTTLDTIDVNATGRIGYKWYLTRPFGSTTLHPDDFELTENGIVMKVKEKFSNWGMTMMDSDTAAGWGYTHGYMETRIRMPEMPFEEGCNAIPAIWAMPPETGWATATEWVEMDFLEYWGNLFSCDPSRRYYTVTMHHQKRVYDTSLDDQVIYWVKNDGTSHHDGLCDNDWHVMGWLWEEGRLTTYVDGQEIMTQRWSEDGEPEPKGNQKRGESQVGAFAPIDKQTLTVNVCGSPHWPLEIDYLNIWQAD